MNGLALLITKKLKDKAKGNATKDLMDPKERERMEINESFDESNPYLDKLNMIAGEMLGAVEAGDDNAFAKYLYKSFLLMCKMKEMESDNSSEEEEEY